MSEMKKSKLSLHVLFFAVVVAVASCDEHVPVVHGIHVGDVVCDDHTVMDTASFLASPGRRAAGVVFALDTERHGALAVRLNEYEDAFSTPAAASFGTSTDVSAYAGFTNTVAMVAGSDTIISPIALWTATSHTSGQSDYIPSVAEMRLLCVALDRVNPVLERLGAVPVNRAEWYWTSTEVQANSMSQAWLCAAANGGIMATEKTQHHHVRSIFELNYPEK